ncbi:putative ATP-synthase-associated protein [Senna tora]|uniref:Putative ATP-synthase-associated protein n=1 Tax=Senna tora TaxID=362788 RepID=A0A834XII3_9FABA|nr:putative ATP-synthase-associated protein [Senna tora]
MGSSSSSSDKDVEKGEYLQRNKANPCLMIFSASLLVSLGGISVLGWWIYKYHPANRELWMVPFGLILFLTPLIVGFSLMISDSEPCVSMKEEEEEEHSLTDLKRFP